MVKVFSGVRTPLKLKRAIQLGENDDVSYFRQGNGW
jgi:hypothetical protein